MSRLDSFIRRMTAQRDILNAIPALIAALPGPVFEFGLGSGRTYDHLRALFPDRRILVFECAVCDHIVRPPDADFMVGDIRDTAAGFPDGSVALVHADIETGVAEADRVVALWLAPLVARLLGPGGYAVSGCDLRDPRLMPCGLPPGIAPDRYHLFQRGP